MTKIDHAAISQNPVVAPAREDWTSFDWHNRLLAIAQNCSKGVDENVL